MYNSINTTHLYTGCTQAVHRPLESTVLERLKFIVNMYSQGARSGVSISTHIWIWKTKITDFTQYE